jgi:hypothetical protein
MSSCDVQATRRIDKDELQAEVQVAKKVKVLVWK